MPSSRESSQPRDGSCISCISCIGRRILYLLCLGIFFLFSEPGLWILCVIAIQLNSTHDFCVIYWWQLCLALEFSLFGYLMQSRIPRWTKKIQKEFSSDQFSRSVISDSLRPHGLQHTRPPCPSPTPGVYLKSCPSSWWCHPTTSSSFLPFSSCLQSFPASGSFPVSQFFASGGQSIGVQVF